MDLPLISLEEYKTLTPREQGYVVYLQADLPGSELKGLENPYPEGTIPHQQWEGGAFMAVLEVQDSEE